MEYRVGIIGFGFVGESQAFAFAPVADIKVYDVDEVKRTHTLEETLSQDFVFVCLPTQMKNLLTMILLEMRSMVFLFYVKHMKPIWSLEKWMMSSSCFRWIIQIKWSKGDN